MECKNIFQVICSQNIRAINTFLSKSWKNFTNKNRKYKTAPTFHNLETKQMGDPSKNSLHFLPDCNRLIIIRLCCIACVSWHLECVKSMPKDQWSVWLSIWICDISLTAHENKIDETDWRIIFAYRVLRNMAIVLIIPTVTLQTYLLLEEHSSVQKVLNSEMEESFVELKNFTGKWEMVWLYTVCAFLRVLSLFKHIPVSRIWL